MTLADAAGWPATMSGVQRVRHGGPGALVLHDDLPVPRPCQGAVLVRVLAASALSFPRIRRADLCGRVSAPGARVICPTNQPKPGSGNPLHKIAAARTDVAEGRRPGKQVLLPQEDGA